MGKLKWQCLLRESECLSEMNHRWRKTKMVIISKNKMNVWETENVS